MSEIYSLSELTRLLLSMFREQPSLWTWGALLIELRCDPLMLDEALHGLEQRGEVIRVQIEGPQFVTCECAYVDARLIKPLFDPHARRN